MEALIKAGADVNRHNAHRHTALHLAAQNGHYGISEMLARAGSNLDAVDLIGEFETLKHTELWNLLTNHFSSF